MIYPPMAALSTVPPAGSNIFPDHQPSPHRSPACPPHAAPSSALAGGLGVTRSSAASVSSSAQTFAQASLFTQTRPSFSSAELIGLGTYGGCFALTSVVRRLSSTDTASYACHVTNDSTQTATWGRSDSNGNSGVDV